MTIQTDDRPVVCTLTPGDLKDRLAWIGTVNRDALRGRRRSDLRLELTYAPEAAERVREMVKREQQCCAFLTFEVREDPDATRLSIVAPESARDAADLLFEQLQSTGSAAAACGCGGALRQDERCGARLNAPAAGIAATAAGGALLCSVCCVLPLALPAVMLTAAGGVITWLAGVAGWAAWVAFAAVVAGWALVWRQCARARLRPATSTLYAMTAATAFLALALGWPVVEPTIVDLILT